MSNRTYELGGPAFDLPRLAQVISEVTGTEVTHRDRPADEYADALQRAGLDEATARFVAAVDSSIARGELETSGPGELARACRHASRRGGAHGIRPPEGQIQNVGRGRIG
jgi:NAD(P)H dehydrogenase (quinone)